MDIKPGEITDILKREIKEYDREIEVREPVRGASGERSEGHRALGARRAQHRRREPRQLVERRVRRGANYDDLVRHARKVAVYSCAPTAALRRPPRGMRVRRAIGPTQPVAAS